MLTYAVIFVCKLLRPHCEYYFSDTYLFSTSKTQPATVAIADVEGESSVAWSHAYANRLASKEPFDNEILYDWDSHAWNNVSIIHTTLCYQMHL